MEALTEKIIICGFCNKQINSNNDLLPYNLKESKYENGKEQKLNLNYNFCRNCFSKATIIISIIRYAWYNPNFKYPHFEKLIDDLMESNANISKSLDESNDNQNITERYDAIDRNNKFIEKIRNLDYSNFKEIAEIFEKGLLEL